MNGRGPSSRAATELEVPMIPTQSQPPTSKWKPPEDGNPLNNATKKVRKEGTKGGAGKRKLNGEEQPGGLVIVRAPSARPWSAQGNDTLPPESSQTRAPSRPPSTQPQTTVDASKPPAKKFKADVSTSSARPNGKGKDRDIYVSTREEPELEEDVRAMQTETETLRRKSQASAEKSAGALEPGFQFPPIRPLAKHQPPPASQRTHDASLPLPIQETPQIERNKVMREGGHRRKSSLSRGKRMSTSFETTGVISQPHTSVAPASFHKHIDGDLPEPQRASQLLIWCSHRAISGPPPDQASQPSSSKQQTTKSGKDPPPLSDEEAQVLKRVEEGVVRMLAEKRIDTNVYGAGKRAETPKPKKENEQNVKNRAREIKFNAHIQRMKAEEAAWVEIANHYNSHRTELLAEISKLESMKAKGKQRASEDDREVSEADLPPHFRGNDNIGLARRVVDKESGEQNALSSRLEDLEYTMDQLHVLTNSALETTHISEADLDRRFATLNISLSSRSQPIPPSLASTTTALSSYMPPSLSRPPPTTDPQDLFRALSRIDAERPRAQVGDAALRAVREVQRANETGAGLSERRLTGVPPPTPRKPPGTPRRATTPGRGR